MSPTLTTRSRWRRSGTNGPPFDVLLLATVQHAGGTWVVVGDVDGVAELAIYGAREFATKFDKLSESSTGAAPWCIERGGLRALWCPESEGPVYE